MKNKLRSERIGDEIQKAISSILVKKYHDPCLQWISITEVVLSKDLSYAKIFFSSIEEERVPEICNALNSMKCSLRKFLSRELNLRIVPDLKFIYDASLMTGSKMDRLIEQSVLKDKKF